MSKRGSHYLRALPIILAFAFSLPALAQNPQLETRNGRAFPTVVFTSIHWNHGPLFDSIAVDSTGDLTYQSATGSTATTGVPYTSEFEIDDSCRTQIFALAERLHYFEGHFTITNSSRPGTTAKTLAFHDPKVSHQITFTSSTDPGIHQLTSIFERIAATLDFERQLTSLYQPWVQWSAGRPRPATAGLVSKLTDLEGAAEQGGLLELQAAIPVVSKIASDPTLPEEVHQRAQAIVNLKPSTCSLAAP